MVEHLPSKQKSLSSNPSTIKKQNKTNYIVAIQLCIADNT
jgi:hypothetical protein